MRSARTMATRQGRWSRLAEGHTWDLLLFVRIDLNSLPTSSKGVIPLKLKFQNDQFLNARRTMVASLAMTAFLLLSWSFCIAAAPERVASASLARNGVAEAVIVVVDSPNSFYSFTAEEQRKYLKLLTGADFDILPATRAASSKGDKLCILIGGPHVNSLVKAIDERKSLRFGELKTDGFYLTKAAVRGRNSLIVGGNDEASTLYAAYELLEQLGVVFMLNKDILPEKTDTLRLPSLDLRSETPFSRRGLAISSIYPNRSIWHLSEVKAFLDQMAKLKLNFLNFGWFEHEPWIDFGYRGEHKLLGDATGKESGYTLWRYHYGSYLVNGPAPG